MIHAVGPYLTEGDAQPQPQVLKKTYEAILQLLEENGLRSVALCPISTGFYGHPKDMAAKVNFWECAWVCVCSCACKREAKGYFCCINEVACVVFVCACACACACTRVWVRVWERLCVCVAFECIKHNAILLYLITYMPVYIGGCGMCTRLASHTCQRTHAKSNIRGIWWSKPSCIQQRTSRVENALKTLHRPSFLFLFSNQSSNKLSIKTSLMVLYCK